MLKRLILAALLLSSPLSAAGPVWTLNDPRGDDYGGGPLIYPMNADYDKGDLDLLSLSAYERADGTLFEAKFARPIRKPERRTVDGIGTSLDQLARYGFYTFNIDIYIDTDNQPGSGSLSTLPGRKAAVDPADGWEKAVCLTPDPLLARNELRRVLVRNEKRRARAAGRRGVVADERRRELSESVADYVFFPDRIRVIGNRVEFFVPRSFLGGPLKPGWKYIVAVSGADVMFRTDQQNRFLREGDAMESLLILPVTTGRPLDRFGGGAEEDEFQPPLVDIIVPAGSDQKKVLSGYDPDTGRPVTLRGVKP